MYSVNLEKTSVGRYAPSPTGGMHLGNARTALLAWLQTRAANGKHILRFEDLDSGRVRKWAYDATRRDLEWLGLDWDEEYLQSERLEHYAHALATLETYPCICTRKEVLAVIQDSAGAPHGEEAIYPATCKNGLLYLQRPAAVRWHVPNTTISVQDQLSGLSLSQHLLTEVGDFVLQRSDLAYAYHLAVVVDDGLMGVTDIVRGQDLWTATPRQVALQQALGYFLPQYWHVPLMTDYKGERLAKRGGAPPVIALREANEEAGKVLAALAKSLGWKVPNSVQATELIPFWQAWASSLENNMA